MFKIGNLGGTLYYEDTPIMRFKFIRGALQSYEVLCNNRNMLPYECIRDGVGTDSIIKFFEARITPETRIGFNALLATTPIKYYHPERIIRYQSGKCIHDRYWLECDDDNSCWD